MRKVLLAAVLLLWGGWAEAQSCDGCGIGYHSSMSATFEGLGALTENASDVTSTKSFILPADGFLEIGADKVRLHSYTAAGATGQNIFLGEGAGNTTMAISGQVYHASRNVGIGPGALANLTTGYFNFALGYNALTANTTGAGNVAIANNVLSANLTGFDNVAIGDNALVSHTGGDFNVAIGHRTMLDHVTGDSNSAYGHEALLNNETGSRNVALGYAAGYSNVSGSDSVFLGPRAGYYETASNVLVIDNATRSSEADGRIKALVYGTFAAAAANQSLRVNGLIQSYLPNSNVYGVTVTNTTFGTTTATSMGLLQRDTGEATIWNNDVEALSVGTTGRVRLVQSGTAAPASGDCDAAGETGILVWDATNDFLYICSGASGWRKITAAAP